MDPNLIKIFITLIFIPITICAWVVMFMLVRLAYQEIRDGR